MSFFADTSGWGHLADAAQQFHTQAASLVRQVTTANRIITTNWIFAELSGLLTGPIRMSKPLQIRYLGDLRVDPRVEVVAIDQQLEQDAWQLWAARPDKDWTITDCASFVVMQQRNLNEALTTDHHYEQAGFVRLLK